MTKSDGQCRDDPEIWILEGQTAERKRDFVASEAHYRRALGMIEAEGLSYSSVLMHLGRCLLVQERYAEAESAYQNALQMLEDHGGELMRIANTLNKLALVCSAQGETESAHQFRSRATRIVAKELRALDGEYWNHGEYWSQE